MVIEHDSSTAAGNDAFLELAENLARYHREHEKFYSRAPLEEALHLQRTSGALKALAERWSDVRPRQQSAAGPYAGSEDLNDDRATELAGILFMENGAEPAEIGKIRRDLAAAAADNRAVGEWLSSAMEMSWAAVETLADRPELADLIAERHRIIANDWRAASLATLIGRHLERAVALLERLDLSPAAIRADLRGGRVYASLLFAACELIDHAADLAAESAAFIHDNERRWRLFQRRVTDAIST